MVDLLTLRWWLLMKRVYHKCSGLSSFIFPLLIPVYHNVVSKSGYTSMDRAQNGFRLDFDEVCPVLD